VPHPFRARQLRYGTARLVGKVFPHSSRNLDESASAVGGGAVILKMIDLAQTSNELAAALNILRDLIKDSWKASEEMERIRRSCLTGCRHDLTHTRRFRATRSNSSAKDAEPDGRDLYEDHPLYAWDPYG